jgi:hypothetical protein
MITASITRYHMLKVVELYSATARLRIRNVTHLNRVRVSEISMASRKSRCATDAEREFDLFKTAHKENSLPTDLLQGKLPTVNVTLPDAQ